MLPIKVNILRILIKTLVLQMAAVNKMSIAHIPRVVADRENLLLSLLIENTFLPVLDREQQHTFSTHPLDTDGHEY